MNEIVKQFDASAFFQNCNQIEMFFENAYEKLQYLEDDQLTDLYGYLSITHKHSWKMQCAILAETQGRVKKRGGRQEEMVQVANRFGISLRTSQVKAKVWNTFFQDDEQDFISVGACAYRFDYFMDGYTWFHQALSSDNPKEAIAYAEQRYDEAEGKYSTRNFRKDIKKGAHNREPLSTDVELPSTIEIIHGTIEEDGKQIANNSVDLIFTDPPYGEEFLPLWDELAKFAYRTLKPSGYLITYSGQFHLPTVMSKLSKTLDYYWTFSLNHSGNKQLINPRQLFCGWKPILIFAKPPLITTETRIDDVIIGSGREKALHDWQQSLEEVKPLIETFSQKSNLIVDPFCGSGTIPLAAYKLNRRAIGIEKEHDNVNIAKGRIANAISN